MILTINPWSSSIKYNLYNQNDLLFWAIIDIKDKKSFEKPIENIISHIRSQDFDINLIKKIWFRIVHWWPKYRKTTKVTSKFLKDFKDLIQYAPIHNSIAYKCLLDANKHFKKVDIYAIFDTSFHNTMLDENKYYSIPRDFSDKYWILKYWFHGISYEYLLWRLTDDNDIKNKKIIICHLWSGCSVCAIRDWKSIDTSMWFTPVSWIMSSKRSWDLDPSIITFLIKKWLKVEEIDDLINNKSWLEWLSWSRDMKTILEKESKWEKIAVFTVNKFVLDVQKTIWAYIAEMWWFDILVFSGGIGEWSAYLRERICEKFGFIDLKIDGVRNVENEQWRISSKSSMVLVFMLKTNEQEQMFRMIS